MAVAHKTGKIGAMNNARQRPVYIAAAVLLVVGLAAWGGYRLAGRAKVTPEGLSAYAQGLELSRLSAAERAKALQRLAEMLNQLGWEERRKARLQRKTDRVFEQMNEQERGDFIDATLPTGFKQMLTSFEQLPEEKRRRAITNSLERLKKARDGDLPPGESSNRPPVLSPELQKHMFSTGLKTFYQQSSAQTKAEVAPLLEEMQRAMESGRFFQSRP